ncbi:MAG: hypothetical protein ACRCS9_15545 [Hyphomicrobium sp.]
MQPFDVIVINAGYEDAAVRGKRGYIIGLVEADQIGVYVYEVAGVWCLHPRDVTPTGTRDEAAAMDRRNSASIRVNGKGEVIG